MDGRRRQQGGQGQAERSDGAGNLGAQGRSHQVSPPPRGPVCSAGSGRIVRGRVAQRHHRAQGPTTWRIAVAPGGTRSDHEARRRIGLEEDRPIDPESLDLGRRWRGAVDDQLGEDPADDRAELEGMGGAQGDERPRDGPGSRSITKSRSGGIVYRQVFV